MARPKIPTIPDDKINYYKEQLYRELSHMFEWKGLPTTVPADYLERVLVRHGYALFYEDENIGQDVLQCSVTGYNRHNMATNARTYTPNTENTAFTIERKIKRLTDGQTALEEFDPTTDGVLIQNMAYGENCHEIVEHFAQRLALAQQAFDTNLMWANVPYIFQTASDDTRLSIEKMFADIFSGQPFVITDKSLFQDNKDRAGLPTDIKFIGKDLMDVHNEIMMKFRQTVGFETAGVDKAERTNTLEIQSNDQHTKTVLQIMLQQRKIACENINAFFGCNVEVDLYEVEDQQEGGNQNGTSNSGTENTPGEN